MALRIDLSDLKSGDEVFTIDSSVIEVERIALNSLYPIETLGLYYDLEGKNHVESKYSTCFHSIEECIEYFQSLKKDMDGESRPKKRYWLWTLYDTLGNPYKSSYYMDNKGIRPKQSHSMETFFYNKISPIKHENEFIDV